jgi:superfamily II DNA or RNA helicase
MPNVSHEELAETKAQPLPSNASIETLKQLRESMCSTTSSRDFKLQSNQRFLRRVLSPDSPTRNLLMVHGTGVGKTCTAIQIAEEYIIRPEFQDKRVLVLANPSIQENFKSQIFDISRVSVDENGLLMSKQCTGRRYLDMIRMSQSQSLINTDKESQQRVMTLANKIIGEFYEFVGYNTFANELDRQRVLPPNDRQQWIRKTFSNRLILVDEAHNLTDTTETDANKLIAIALEEIVRVADGITLVLMTATPMYDSFDEILYYLKLFLLNDRRIDEAKMVTTKGIFNENGDFKEGKEQLFRKWCQEYVSFVRGENPFTFPFRLPPPDKLIALPDRTIDINGKDIQQPRKYLTLTKSFVSPEQKKAIEKLKVQAVPQSELICVYPENKTFRETFNVVEGSFNYKDEKFLAPSKVGLYSSKFGLIMNIIASTTGIVFVYSNIVESGAQLFAMCLEEHGYESASERQLLKETSGEVPRGSKGKYALFTSEVADSQIKKLMVRLKRPSNADGSDIRIVIASPKVSEGVDFRNVRQIHVLDPWFNMSRIEQVLGRGMRTCSHSLLPFEEQNCTVYLHVCRFADSTKETVDEYIYRVFVERKGVGIAKVKRFIMESAMDCELQLSTNSLPSEWRGEPDDAGQRFLIPQHRNQDPVGTLISLPLSVMSAPTFEEGSYQIQCKLEESVVDEEHERPLSAILDVKDEVLDKLLKLFMKKPVWKKTDLFAHQELSGYTPSTLSYIIQRAIDSGFQLKDKNGRIGHLESKGDVFAFGIGDHDTLVERLVEQEEPTCVTLPTIPNKQVEVEVVKPKLDVELDSKRNTFFSEGIRERFKQEVLDWYIVDSVLSKEEKRAHMLQLDWSNPPVYASPLIVKTSENKNLYVLGSKEIYNDAKEKIEPVGIEGDAYRNWLKMAKDKFIENKDKIFASVKDEEIIFNIDEKADVVRTAKRSKNIGGRKCTTFQLDLLNKFSEWLSGSGFPEKVNLKKSRCLFLELLIREAIIGKKEGIVWLTPEEYSVFDEDDNRADLIKRIK